MKKVYKIYAFLLIVSAAAYLLSVGDKYYGIGINTSDSVPQTVFVLQKKAPLSIGNYVAFKQKTPFHEENTLFVKRLAGKPGDTVVHKNGSFYINGFYIGDVLGKTSKGEPLSPGFEGVIPGSFYFVVGEHPLSLDSRYQEMGLVHEDAIVARAVPVY